MGKIRKASGPVRGGQPLQVQDSSDEESPEEQTLKSKFSKVVEKVIEEAILTQDLSTYTISNANLEKFKIVTTKLKSKGQMNCINVDNIIKFFTILSNSIENGIDNNQVDSDDGSSHDKNILDQSTFLRITSAVDASIISLLILTSDNMDFKVYIEDIIDKVVLFVTIQMRSTLLPVYKNDNTKMNKYKKNKNYKTLCQHFSEIIELLGELMKLKKFHDNIILEVTSLGMLTLTSNVQCLELASVSLFISLFSHYEKHQELILDDIISFMSKDNVKLSPYQLKTGERIHIFTALTLLLVQSSVHLTNVSKSCESESIILEKWTSVKVTTIILLKNIFTKITKPEGKDLRHIFDIFIQDILLLLKKPDWPIAELFLQGLASQAVNNINKTTHIQLRTISLDCLTTILVHLKNDMMTKVDFEILEKTKKSYDFKNIFSNNDMNMDDFTQIALLSILTSESEKNPLCQDAIKFCLIKWFAISCDKTFMNKKRAPLKSKNLENLEESSEIQKKLRSMFLEMIVSPINNNKTIDIPGKIFKTNEINAIINYIYRKGTFYNSFSTFFSSVLKTLKDSSVILRSKVLKCLSNIIKLDPDILENSETKMAVTFSLSDISPQVRETTVDLIGKFISLKPDCFKNYFEALVQRTMDVSVSVRKSALKIIMTMCQGNPDLESSPELLLKIISRVKDEPNIQNMVKNFFYELWFEPVSESPKLNTDTLVKKTYCMVSCIENSTDFNISHFEILFSEIFKDKPTEDFEKSCKQIIDCLIEMIIQLEKRPTSKNLSSCFKLVNLFSKYQAKLLIPHVSVLQSYLTIKCSDGQDSEILSSGVKSLSEVVPLMSHPQPNFLTQLQKSLIEIIMNQDPRVMISAVLCLSKIIPLTQEHSLIKDSFNIFYKFLENCKTQIVNTSIPVQKSSLNRSIFAVGLFIQYFDLNESQNTNFPNNIIQTLLSFKLIDKDTLLCILKAIGFICIRYPRIQLENDVKLVYIENLSTPNAHFSIKSQILNNLEKFLESDDTKYSKEVAVTTSYKTKIKEFADIQMGMAGNVVLHYLNNILNCFFNENIGVRNSALRVTRQILIQGLVDPLQIVPYLICLCTDEDKKIRISSEKYLEDIEAKFPGYCHIKALIGMDLSFKFQGVVSQSQIARGYRTTGKANVALNSFLFSLLKTKQQKRSFLLSLIRQLDEHSKIGLKQMLYVADNLAYFPYSVLDDPLYVIHQIDVVLSTSGSNLIQIFKENMSKSTEEAEDTDSSDDEKFLNMDNLISHLPKDLTSLRQTAEAFRGCLLLGNLKQHIKKEFNINFNKIKNYSPSDSSKTHERTLQNRRSAPGFNPQSILDDMACDNVIPDGGSLIKKYLELKKLINNLDVDETQEKRRSFEKSFKSPENIETPDRDESLSPLNFSGISHVSSSNLSSFKSPSLVRDNKRKVTNGNNTDKRRRIEKSPEDIETPAGDESLSPPNSSENCDLTSTSVDDSILFQSPPLLQNKRKSGSSSSKKQNIEKTSKSSENIINPNREEGLLPPNDLVNSNLPLTSIDDSSLFKSPPPVLQNKRKSNGSCSNRKRNIGKSSKSPGNIDKSSKSPGNIEKSSKSPNNIVTPDTEVSLSSLNSSGNSHQKNGSTDNSSLFKSPPTVQEKKRKIGGNSSNKRRSIKKSTKSPDNIVTPQTEESLSPQTSNIPSNSRDDSSLLKPPPPVLQNKPKVAEISSTPKIRLREKRARKLISYEKDTSSSGDSEN